MFRLLSLILPFFLCQSLWFNAQIRLTQAYPTPPRSIAISILNPAGPHFYFLRFNKLAHDITIEKRRKSDGSVSGFVALRLDSVNASWFDYELLDHLFFEKGGRLYFVFEKVLNSQRQLFMKEIDTLCRPGGFIELVSLKMEKRESAIELDFVLTHNKEVLVTCTRIYGSTVYRDVQQIDPLTRQVKFRRKLPVENPATGYSGELCFDPGGQLYYLLVRYRSPVLLTTGLLDGSAGRDPEVDSVFMVSIDSSGKFVGQRSIPLLGCDQINAAFLSPAPAGSSLNCFYTRHDTSGGHLSVAALSFDSGLSVSEIKRYDADSGLIRRLTFYDGSEIKSAAAKRYEPFGSYTLPGNKYFFSERRSSNEYRELVWWSNDREDIRSFDLIPRKTLFLRNRVEYSTYGMPMLAANDNTVYVFLLEHPANIDVAPSGFRFRKFRKLESEKGARLVAYVLRSGTYLAKQNIWLNTSDRCIPLNYRGSGQEAVFYFISGDGERFGLLPLSQQ